jgi:hypothetical protein
VAGGWTGGRTGLDPAKAFNSAYNKVSIKKEESLED